MSPLLMIGLVSWLAGIAAFVGGCGAQLEGSAESEGKRELIHGIVAFGGGILVAAVAFALVPEGMAALPLWALALAFCGGGLVFCALDALITRHAGNRAQFLAMLLDFVPEALALGALFGHGGGGMLLALFIGAQNLPEGFNAHRENVGSGVAPRTSLLALLGVSLLGPLAACCGYLFLRDQPLLTGTILSAAAGGILYLVFQDIAPQAQMRRHWSPTLGAVLGFAFGMVGKELLG